MARFVSSSWVYDFVILYSIVYPSVVFHFAILRIVAVTLELNNFSSIAQIPIKLYIFGIFLGYFEFNQFKFDEKYCDGWRHVPENRGSVKWSENRQDIAVFDLVLRKSGLTGRVGQLYPKFLKIGKILGDFAAKYLAN